MAGRHGFGLASLIVLCLVISCTTAGRKGRCEVCKSFVKAFEEVSFKWRLF